MTRRISIAALLFAVTASAAEAQPLHRAPGSAQAIAVGPQNQMFAIGPAALPGGDGHVFRWTGRNWERFTGNGVRIAVDHNGNPWLVNSRNQVWRYRAGQWAHLGSGIDIATGGGQIFILGTDRPAPGNGTVYRWSENGWSRFGGWGSRLAVDNRGFPWLVNTSNEIWRYAGRWEKLPGTARSIGIGPGGHGYIIGTDNPAPGNGGLYRWDNGRWTGIGGYGVEITANAQGRPIVVNSHQQVWGPFDAPPAPAAFGHGVIRVRERPARGARPIAVVLMEYQDQRFRPESTRAYSTACSTGSAGLSRTCWVTSARSLAGRSRSCPVASA